MPALPDYPRAQIAELYLASRDPEHPFQRDRAPFVVLGMLEHDPLLPDGPMMLAAPFAVCCMTHGLVRFQIAPSEDAPALEPGTWVAVFGRLAAPMEAATTRRRGVVGFSQVIAPLAIIPERIAPARSLRSGACVTEALEADSLSIFRGLLETSGLVSELRAVDGVVILAPINAVFESLTGAERAALDEPTDPEELRPFILRHIVLEDLTRDQLLARSSVRSAAHADLPVETSPSFRIAGARVLFVDSSSRNGIVCIIDRIVQEETEPDATDQPGSEPRDSNTP